MTIKNQLCVFILSVKQANLVYKFIWVNYMNNSIYQVSIDPGNELILYKPHGISIYDPRKFDNFSTGKDQAHSFCGELGWGENGFFGFGHRENKTIANLGWLF